MLICDVLHFLGSAWGSHLLFLIWIYRIFKIRHAQIRDLSLKKISADFEFLEDVNISFKKCWRLILRTSYLLVPCFA